MPDSDDFGSASFSSARRGYDRAEVDSFVQRVRVRVESLEAEVVNLNAKVVELGGTLGDDLRAELSSVSRDVDKILQSAREAAQSMRTRASEDASKWRGEADDECRIMRQEAETQAFQLRQAAWEASTDMLDQLSAASADAMRLAQQDALFIRAEAEREALRLTGDARRDIEEELRAAKTEAERAVANARAEGESILDAARQSAEVAQERALALEERRSELMGELESARSSIDQLESEIDSRRNSIQNAGMGETGVRVVSPEVTPTQIESIRPAPQGWIDDDASVRIVRPAEVPAVMAQPTALVDADELVAEVLQLREAQEHREAQGALTESPEIAIEADSSEVEIEAINDDDLPLDEAPMESSVEPEDQREAAPIQVDVSGDSEAVVSVEDEVEEHSRRKRDPGVDQLFASLRTVDEPKPVVAEQPESEAVAFDEESARSDESDPEPAAEPVSESVAPIELAVDPFELRERLLLPIENRALRGVKRTIVGLQNRVLEDLRVAGDEWSPEAVMFTATFEPEIETLTNEAVVAGYAGAGEMLGLGQIPHPKGGRPQDQTAPFVGQLVEAIAVARDSAKSSGGGGRQQAAAVSRVFRAWRTDEAGRRLRDAAYSAYHEGLIRALGAAGVGMVSAVPRGRSHAECPAVTSGPWDPVHAVAGTLVVPPASAGCECTVVPAGNGR